MCVCGTAVAAGGRLCRPGGPKRLARARRRRRGLVGEPRGPHVEPPRPDSNGRAWVRSPLLSSSELRGETVTGAHRARGRRPASPAGRSTAGDQCATLKEGLVGEPRDPPRPDGGSRDRTCGRSWMRHAVAGRCLTTRPCLRARAPACIWRGRAAHAVTGARSLSGAEAEGEGVEPPSP